MIIRNRLYFEKIKKYFEKDYSYEIIINKLFQKYQLQISARTLLRILKENNLRRRNIVESSYEEIVLAIICELEGSGYNLGYKAMWQRLRKIYQLKVRQKTVMTLLQKIDPDGVEGRSRYRLKRRMYSVPGPNYMWHADGHDKLKRFGFAIYGIIDGFSRKILSLDVSTSNNDPKIIAFYYLKLIEKRGFIPTIIRTDHGTEVTIMEDIHVALRYMHPDENAGDGSFLKGRSTHNQRIEAYWLQFRKHMGDFYMQLFKKMEVDHLLDISNPLHIECLRYCFHSLVKEDILATRKEWNEHNIRKQSMRMFTGAKPNEMYDCPEKFRVLDYQKPLIKDKMQILFDKYSKQPKLVSPDFIELVNLLSISKSPRTAEEAYELYLDILEAIANQ